MTIDLLSYNENCTTEFKEKVNDNFFKSLSAFANTDGGCILLGVRDDKSIEGFNGQQEGVINQIIDCLGIQPKIEVENIQDKEILLVKVEKSNNLIAYKNIYYKRIGNTTRVMPQNEIRERLLEGISWESQTGNFFTADINENSIRNFVKYGISAGRLPSIPDNESIDAILEKLGLVINGKITNAGILLFGKNPQKYFINANVRVGAFKSNDATTIISDKVIEGNLFEQVEKAEEAIKFAINVKYSITGKTSERQEIWDYPLSAIRETLLNSIVHRDYFDKTSPIQIKIFKDWLWFYNPGELVDDLTIENLKTSHPSKTRNPLIASIFYRAGLIEKFGSGIDRIMNACRKEIIPQPEFLEECGGFSVKFKKEFAELNERQNKALSAIKEKSLISNSEYQEITGATRETSKRDLALMLKLGILHKVGEGKTTKYSAWETE